MSVLAIGYSGNKRVEYRNFVREIINDLPKNSKVIDVFGGSGLIAINVKRDRPDLIVTLNDFDNFLSDEYMEINDIKKRIYEDLKNADLHASDRKCENVELLQKIILSHIKNVTSKRVIRDVIRDFMFSSKDACGNIDINNYVNDLLYIRKIPEKYVKIYDNAIIYFEASKKIDNIIHCDYSNINLCEYDLIILDPPYLNSSQKQYNKEMFFSVADTINIIQQIPTDRKFILFNQNHKDIIKIFEILHVKVIKENKTLRSMCHNTLRDDWAFYCVRLSGKCEISTS